MGSSYHCFKVNRPIYKVYNMTIPIKLRDPNTKVETKQKILINMDVSKKYKYHIANEYSTYIFGDN